ncbi:MAG: N-formylglutamate amidohydrolase [Myxococcales bacterium]|nr:N-formylglutamate amidohydrolase [Myxococcales bacterium]
MREADQVFGVVERSFTRQMTPEPTTPVVVSIPHAGTETSGFDETLSPELDVRCDADLHVDQLYRIGKPDAPEVNVVARASRFVCDLNRDPDDVSPGAVPEHGAARNREASDREASGNGGRGFIWAVTTAGLPALARPLTLDEWRARTAIHAGYHGALADAIARARARFGFAILVDGHSMPSRGKSGHKDPGRARADIVPGDRDGTSCSPALSKHVGDHFAAGGYGVAFNDPYKGGFITTHHGRPADDVHAIQIELRRDLYMNEATYEIEEGGFARLSDTLAELLASLRSFKP